MRHTRHGKCRLCPRYQTSRSYQGPVSGLLIIAGLVRRIGDMTGHESKGRTVRAMCLSYISFVHRYLVCSWA
ncbi:hypothetical protein DL95DRAFT_383246, partial [Leptodontidium sp. 2 PMI_412]